MKRLLVANTQYKGGLSTKDYISANNFLIEYGCGWIIEYKTFQSKYKPVSGDPAKMNAVWLDTFIHRPRLDDFHLSCFTTTRDEAYKLSPGRTNLRGYQSYPTFPIGEVVVYTRDGDYITQKGKTTQLEQPLTQGAYTLLHEIVHWFYDLDKQTDTLHRLLKKAARRGQMYEQLAALLKNIPPMRTIKYTPDFAPIKRELSSYWEGNNPKSIVLHTLAGTIEGSYQWLEHIKLSYNYMIGSDGTVYEPVHWSRSAWHAGVLSNPDKVITNFYKGNPNRESIGISFERKGEAELTDKQVSASVALTKWLGQQTGVHYDINNVFYHQQITDYKPFEVQMYREQFLDALAGERGVPPVDVIRRKQKTLVQLLKELITKLTN